MRLTVRLLGAELVSVEYRATRPPEPREPRPAADPDAVVQDMSDTSGGGDVVHDPAVPFGFAAEVIAMPSTVLQPVDDDDEEGRSCQEARPRIGFSTGS